jgi:protoporphyrinogen oxidase
MESNSDRIPHGLRARRIAIIGAGPTGLGAAYRLSELGHQSFTVFERNAFAGGLAASFCDPSGFTWDVGGHVHFSHYEYFDRVMDRTMGDEWVLHDRESWIWIRDRFVPYPFQNNIHFLPDREKRECLVGLLRRSKNNAAPPANFAEWIRASFGDGIAETFMLPYNFKVWAYPPAELDYKWIGERVAEVDLERIVLNLLDNRVDGSWGPNNRFRFPARGGTGEIWRRLAADMPEDTIRYGCEVTRIAIDQHVVYFSDGSREPYDTLISTMPLDQLLSIGDDAGLKTARDRLKYSTVHVFGIGLAGSAPARLASKCWIYFPESTCPFYRLTVFSKYSPRNVPNPERYWSLIAEVSASPAKPVDGEHLSDQVIDGLLTAGVISSKANVVTCWRYTAEHGYPTPFLNRDATVEPLLRAFERHGIFSRGRFGAWKYEVSNQDHSFMQGVEVVNHLAFGTPEMTLHQPATVNARKS